MLNWWKMKEIMYNTACDADVFTFILYFLNCIVFLLYTVSVYFFFRNQAKHTHIYCHVMRRPFLFYNIIYKSENFCYCRRLLRVYTAFPRLVKRNAYSVRKRSRHNYFSSESETMAL